MPDGSCACYKTFSALHFKNFPENGNFQYKPIAGVCMVMFCKAPQIEKTIIAQFDHQMETTMETAQILYPKYIN